MEASSAGACFGPSLSLHFFLFSDDTRVFTMKSAGQDKSTVEAKKMDSFLGHLDSVFFVCILSRTSYSFVWLV